MIRWAIRLAAVLAAALLLHQGLVLGARGTGGLGRSAADTCVACH